MIKRATGRLLVALGVGAVVFAGTGGATGAPTAVHAAGTTTVAAQVSVESAARKPTWRPTQGGKFNVPRVGGDKQYRLEKQVVSAIRHARKGSQIKISLFSFDRFPVADALIAAHRRGVDVKVLMNDHEEPRAQKKLRRVIGKNRSKRSYIYQCQNGCRSTGENNHSKFFLFSHTGAARDVVMVGSVNMKLNGSKNQYNDLWTKNDAPALYATFDDLFRRMRPDKVDKPTYMRREIGKNFMLQVTPFHNEGPDNDPIDTVLDPVKCKGARGGTGTNGRTLIRVNMHAWNGRRGTYLAERFRKLYAAGCDVKLQYGYAGKLVRDEFGIKTPRGYMPIRANGFDTDGDEETDLYSHMKLLIITGNYGGDRSAKVVVTGSSNYQDSGVRGDEVILRMLNQDRTTAQYLKNWKWMWENRTREVPHVQPKRSTDRFGRPLPERRVYLAGPGIDSPEWEDE
ncbi:phospholipase D-like domain-containing protein [Nocardioides ferulae]|uniref:phospholipase D-like domain-containing protein n=1 Tax=Nocardioides ferulae TaxID=2340821 RepID=UPI0013DE536F|nr:phospholipase D-like domain-containing protein [Nocardioides ferulae]